MDEEQHSTSLWAVGPRPPARARLAVLVGLSDSTPALVPLRERETVVGRAAPAELVLELRGVSRRHAKLLLTPPAEVSVLDLRSRNGTFVNGRRVEVAQLQEGDEIHFGPHAAFRFTRNLVEDVAVLDPGRALPRVDLQQLTARETQVAEQVATGLSNAAVAQALGIKPRTVATHLEHIYAKLGLRSRADLVRVLIESRRG